MQIVYAYRDAGWMSEVTRWKPRRVFCTEGPDHGDRPGVEYVVKFRQEKAGTAALVSEVVSWQLLVAGGWATLDARLVEVSREFAASYASVTDVPYRIIKGTHFGTVRRFDVEDGPPLTINHVAEPQQLVDIWVFDTWVCNTDRNVHGNILLVVGPGGRFNLIAADQSDCFGGAGRFADGSWKKVLEESGGAQPVQFWQTAVYDAGSADALRRSLQKVEKARNRLDDAIAAVPQSWWQDAGINPNEVQDALDRRARRLADILDVDSWEKLDEQFPGAYLL